MSTPQPQPQKDKSKDQSQMVQSSEPYSDIDKPLTTDKVCLFNTSDLSKCIKRFKDCHIYDLMTKKVLM